MLSPAAITFLSGSVLCMVLATAPAIAQSIQYTAPAAAPAPAAGFVAPVAPQNTPPGYGYLPVAPSAVSVAQPVAAAKAAPQPYAVPAEAPRTLNQQAQQQPSGYVPSVPAGGIGATYSQGQSYQMMGTDKTVKPTLFSAPMPAPQALKPLASTPSSDSFFVSGGVGKAERDRFEAMSSDYNFKMQMATSGGEFISDVNVQIKDAKGNAVLETVTEGPMLMAKLPSGTYLISATKFGETKTQTVQVSEKGSKKINIFWRHDPA